MNDMTFPELITTRAGFDRDTFEQFVEMRGGTGDPVYWYGCGVITSYPEGKPIARIEGVDLGKLLRPDTSVPKAKMLTRKFVAFRDYETNELLRDENGKMRFIGYGYQNFTWSLEGDQLLYEIEQGSKDSIVINKGGQGAEVRTMGGLTVMTTPVPINSRVVQAWEKYDFLILPDGSPPPRYQSVWGKYTPNFSWMGEGFCTMYMWSYRYDSFETLPESYRNIVLNEPGMLMWKLPPMDLDEIAELQRTGQNYR